MESKTLRALSLVFASAVLGSTMMSSSVGASIVTGSATAGQCSYSSSARAELCNGVGGQPIRATGTPDPTSSPAATVLTFDELGLTPSYSFGGNGAAAVTAIPLPLALTPRVLEGRLILPANLGAGYLNVTSGNSQLGTIAVSAASVHQTTTHFAFNLTGITSRAGYSPLTFTFVQTQSAVVCGSLVTLIMDNLQVAFSGDLVTPHSISTFFPSVLSDVLIYVQAPLTPSREQAAVNVAASTVHRFNPMPFHVEVRSWDTTKGLPAVNSRPFERVIAIRSGPKGVHVALNDQGTPVLVLSGSDTSLALQSEDLAGAPNALSQTNVAIVHSVSPVSTLSLSTKTFSQLGIAGSFVAAGQNSLFLGIDQSLFGGNAAEYRVHLGMNYSPVADGDRGSAVAKLNGLIIASTQLNAVGKSSLDFTIPPQAIQRLTGIELTVTYYPVGGVCSSGYRTMQFNVDPQSTVTETPNLSGVGGFSAVPAALTPTFQVAFDRHGFERLGVACSLVVGLGQLTNQLLVPMVTPWSVAKSDGLPLLVVGSSSRVRFSDAPLSAVSGSTVLINAVRAVHLDPRIPLASVSVFADSVQHRTVVEAMTSGSFSLFTPIFTYLGNDSKVWQGLIGDLLAAGPAAHVANLAIKAGLPTDQQFVPVSVNRVVWYGLALSLLGLVLFVLLTWWFIHRRQKSAERDVARETEVT